ncbi:hypothetical protein BC832DRAFT_550651 [Gaertneriomyces semiglobifer]|nr:hypothetical protein BC832DRAFT_550651 [Gaertneriomyces semiglobifer]
MLSAIRLPGSTKEKNSHAWPQPQSTLLLTVLITIWYMWTSPTEKLRGLIGAGLFSVTEYIFYTVTIEEPDGTIKMRPWDSRCRKGHTTVHQFLANIITIPFFILAFWGNAPTALLRIVGLPFVIWMMEMAQGYTFIYLYGYNPAWIYRGPEAFFHGTINVGYFGYWLMMGVALEYAVFLYLIPLLGL